MAQDQVMESAENLMKARRYGEAIEAFKAILEEHPDNLEALLELGLCHLLNRSERAFLAIHDFAALQVAGAGRLPARLARLWSQYQTLFRRISASALVIGSLSGLAIGCRNFSEADSFAQTSSSEASAQAANSGDGVKAEETETETETEAQSTTEAQKAAKPQEAQADRDGARFAVPPDQPEDARPQAVTEGERPKESEPGTLTEKGDEERRLEELGALKKNLDNIARDEVENEQALPQAPTSMHRYSGGVFLPKRPVPQDFLDQLDNAESGGDQE